MDKIEKIRQEIERRRLHFNKEAEKYQALNNGYSQNCYGARDALRDLENFLDTLSEEPDKSLDEAAEKYSDKYCSDWAYRLEYEDAFQAGAEWQYQKDRGEFAKIKAKTWCEGFDAHKQQMLNDAVEAEVLYFGETQDVSRTIKIPRMQEWLKPFKDGDKVRIVILKEEEE